MSHSKQRNIEEQESLEGIANYPGRNREKIESQGVNPKLGAMVGYFLNQKSTEKMTKAAPTEPFYGDPEGLHSRSRGK